RRVKNGRPSGTTRRSTRRSDSSQSVPWARVMVKASFAVRAVSRSISGGSRQAKAIENSMPSADNTDGNPQASIPWPTERGGDPLVERSAEQHLAQAPRRGAPYEGGGAEERDVFFMRLVATVASRAAAGGSASG